MITRESTYFSTTDFSRAYYLLHKELSRAAYKALYNSDYQVAVKGGWFWISLYGEDFELTTPEEIENYFSNLED